ncbi:MAG: ion transporter [Bacteroidetes bacterium]|jgi:inward rectifier potassium channel|nr:ion transporter [Bacteroidota bacterium]
MSIFNNKKSSPELGFGNKNYNKNVRFINQDGRINVKRTGLGRLGNLDIYHWFITISLPKLILVIILGYTVMNFLFAGTYYLIGCENFGGLEMQTEMTKFMSLFFFSAQTLTTVGYGHVYPTGIAASSVSAIESLTGLLGFALATGILYGRFSRPKADLLYSKNALMAPYMGITGLMFRITNKMQYELIECEASVTISYNDPETKKREFDQLKLEISKINFLTLSWTIVHPIDDESPIKGWTLKDMEDRDMEMIILMKAINDTFSQTVYSRYSYKADEMIEKAKFKPLKQEATRNGRIVISVGDIHEYDAVQEV